MDQLQTDAILSAIYTERKSIVKFMETIFGFLIRNTNFQLMKDAENSQPLQSLWELLSICDQVPKSLTDLENGEEECAPPAAAEIEIETETGDIASELQLQKLIPLPEATLVGKLSIKEDQNGFDQAGISTKSQTQNCYDYVRKYRTILPKKFSLSDNIPVKLSTNHHEKSNTVNRRVYKCSECSDILNSFRQLKMHESLHISQADERISICMYCCSLYANAETLERHINECHTNGRYLCVPCAKTYKSRGQLLKHVHSRAHNARSLLYYCSLCPRAENSYAEFSSRSTLQQHYQETHLLMPVNQNEDDVEIEMNEEFLDEFLLNNVNENSFDFSECWGALDLNLPDMLHLVNAGENYEISKNNTVENKEFAFKCPMCYDGFAKQKFLLHHIAHKHELPVLICNKCDCCFKDYTQWIQHKRTHRVQFDTNQNTNGKLLKCEICDKIFRSNAALNYHVKTHLRNVLHAPHECPYCQKYFYSDTTFKQHIRIVHSLTKRHKCELCDKPFATLDHLKKHVLSQHQNERKNICHICAKSFTQLCHLKQHLTIHTVGKSHQCMKCKVKFWRKLDLQRHVYKMHS